MLLPWTLQVVLHLTVLLLHGVAASFNLYVRPPEVKRLLEFIEPEVSVYNFSDTPEAITYKNKH